MPNPWEKYSAPSAPATIQTRPADPKLPLEIDRMRQQMEIERERLRIAQQQAELDARNAARAAGKDAREGKTLEARGGVDSTEAERTAAFLATRVAGGLSDLARIGVKKSPSLKDAVIGGTLLGNYATDEDRQRTIAAQKDILDAALTLGTGAAYTKEQIDGYRASYFPQPGDGEGTIKDKSIRLRRLLEAARLKSGASAGLIDGALKANGDLNGAGDDRDGAAIPASALPPSGPGRIEADPTGNRNFATALDKRFAQEAQDAFNNGADRAQLDAIAKKYGAQPFGADLDQAIKGRQAGARTQFTTPTTGREAASLTGQLLGGAADSWFGAANIAGANALTGGSLDEIVGFMGGNANTAQAAKEFAAQEHPYAALGGGALGAGLAMIGVNRVLGALPGGLVRGGGIAGDLLYGAGYGAGESNENRIGGAVAGAAGGLAGNLIGQGVGRYALAPIADKVAQSNVGQAAINRTRRMFGRGPVAPAPAPSAADQAIAAGAGRDVLGIRDFLTEAQSLGVPASLADASPELRSLAGAAVRRSPTASGIVENTLLPRNRGQIDRFRSAVERDLGPVTNIPERSEKLIEAAKNAAGPLYDAAYSAPGVEDLQINDILGRPSMQRAMGNARKLAMEEGRDPYTLGFVMNDAGDVTIPAFGRYVEARGEKPPSPMSVISGQGNSAPSDLVTFVRRNGGMRDTGRFESKGGEMRSMGFTNAGRKGTPMAGQDAKFGPLVNDNGLTYDEMAERAWEAGYFGPPSTTPRPTEREFLDALDDTYRGTDRRFSIHDEDTVNQYDHYQRLADEWNAAEGVMLDRSSPAGPREFAPPAAYGNMEEIAPTWQTLDYVKRGLDDVLQAKRDAGMGRLDTEGRAVNNTLQELLGRVDAANPAYAEARAAYAGPMQERGFLTAGQDAVRANPDQLGVDVAGLTPQRMEQMRLGFQSGLSDMAEKVRLSSNPFDATLNTPAMQRRIGVLYPDAPTDRLFRTADMERSLAATSNDILGNSKTAQRQIADDAFKSGDGARMAIEGAASVASGVPIAPTAINRLGQSLGRAYDNTLGRAAVRKADEIAPILVNPDPGAALAQINDILSRNQAYSDYITGVRSGARRVGGMFGATPFIGLSQ